LFDITNLRPTIEPKSDQLNADQLLGGSITIDITDVQTGTADQPVVIHYDGDNGRPYKPCKTMRKVLILAWGEDGRRWVGQSMTLYHDPAVKFGGLDVGGVRISHLSGIDRCIQVSLNATRGKKALHVIDVLKPAINHDDAIRTAVSVDALKAAFGAAYQSTKDKATKAAYKNAYDKRLASMLASQDDGGVSADPGDMAAPQQSVPIGLR
jgi:hypothetical protein